MSPHRPGPRSRAGFTLLEIMTVLVIAGIVAGLAAPRLSGFLDRQKETQAINRVATDLSTARMMAIRSGNRVSVVRHSSTQYSIGLQGGTTASRRQVRLDQDFPGVSVTFPGDGSIVFNSRGIVEVGTGVIGVTLKGQTHALQVSATGRTQRVH